MPETRSTISRPHGKSCFAITDARMKALSHLILEPQVISELSGIAGIYGEVISICSLNPNNLDERLYIVGFRDAQSAMSASIALGCRLYGYKEMVVWIPHCTTMTH